MERIDIEVFAYLLRQKVIDFGMSGDRGYLKLVFVDKDAVIGAFPKQRTTASFKVLEEFFPLHQREISSFSRTTVFPAMDRWVRIRFASRIRRIAFFRFFRVSLRVAPWVLAPGSSSTKPMYPSATFWKIAVNGITHLGGLSYECDSSSIAEAVKTSYRTSISIVKYGLAFRR
jgi:hypothetical protein